MNVFRTTLLSIIVAAMWCADSTVTVTQAWARATAPSAANGAVFFTLTNASETEARVTAVHGTVSATTELHGHRTTDKGVQMYQLDHLAVPAKSSVELAPGGMHVMLLGLTAPLKEGTTITLDLTLAGMETPLRVDAKVLGIAAMGIDAGDACCHE